MPAQQQEELKFEEALATLNGLDALTEQSAHVGLSYSLQLSKAAVIEQQGQLDQALAAYQSIASATRTSHPAHALTADLGTGRVLLLQADDADNADELRQQAYDILTRLPTDASVVHKRPCG